MLTELEGYALREFSLYGLRPTRTSCSRGESFSCSRQPVAAKQRTDLPTGRVVRSSASSLLSDGFGHAAGFQRALGEMARPS